MAGSTSESNFRPHPSQTSCSIHSSYWQMRHSGSEPLAGIRNTGVDLGPGLDFSGVQLERRSIRPAPAISASRAIMSKNKILRFMVFVDLLGSVDSVAGNS